jgi:hypothetical protein
MAACRWKGVTRRGCGQSGAMGIAPAGLPAWVEARYRRGWRRLVVTAAGDGREAARIGPAGDGGRTWHAERA